MEGYGPTHDVFKWTPLGWREGGREGEKEEGKEWGRKGVWSKRTCEYTQKPINTCGCNALTCPVLYKDPKHILWDSTYAAYFHIFSTLPSDMFCLRKSGAQERPGLGEPRCGGPCATTYDALHVGWNGIFGSWQRVLALQLEVCSRSKLCKGCKLCNGSKSSLIVCVHSN